MATTASSVSGVERLPRLERRLERERLSRLQAEQLLEAKSRELYLANQRLSELAADLEKRVEDRTLELLRERERAIILAEHDQLTGLANRERYLRILSELDLRVIANGESFALLLIDLDHFKRINETLGPKVGDVFLCEIAQRLVKVTRGEGTVARVGGDEFAVIRPNAGLLSESEALAERIIEAVRQPLRYRDKTLQGSCSIGIAQRPTSADDIDELRRFAAIALHRSKTSGRSVSTSFDQSMRDEENVKQLVAAELHDAIAQGQIVPWFQTIVEAGNNRPCGVEALARWQHPEQGLLPPQTFIRLAEDSGLIDELFGTMLRQACRACLPWMTQNHLETLSINLSPRQFGQRSLTDAVLGILAETGFPPSRLTVEITEEIRLCGLEQVAFELKSLARRGVRIALDDFGTGYSSISYLKALPVNSIKLDRAMTADVVTDAKARAVVRALVQMAQALDLKIIAEGVESHAQAAWLAETDIGYLQGYLYSLPMPAEEMRKLLAPAI